MACNWRIRHKLMLGVGLVIIILGLLVTGALFGLNSYRNTMRTIDGKLFELTEAYNLLSAIKELTTHPSSNVNLQAVELNAKIQKAREALKLYMEKLKDTTERVPDEHRYQTAAKTANDLVTDLNKCFEKLDAEVREATHRFVVGGSGTPLQFNLLTDRAVQDSIHQLVRMSADLNNIICQDLSDRILHSKEDYRLSLGIVFTTCVLAVLLMGLILRFVYRWIFYPIRDLEQGVCRVAQGNFEHRIEVHSGDEMEDLAQAFNDMTKRLREMYCDLERQVNDRSRQLVRSERLASVGFLAAGVAHEINNPLASIAFCSEALERRLSEYMEAHTIHSRRSVDEQEREIIAKYLKMIQEEAFRCKKITERLLEFSRGGERRREITDIGELTQSVLDMVAHLENSRGKELVFHQNDKVVIPVNAQEIKSVIVNLVVNALDSMDEGGKLAISQRIRDGMAELTVQDTGCGMTAEVLENIFEPFFTRSRTGKGNGLGLSISHRIVNQHGGEIEACSPGPNQGSVFTVRLPMTSTMTEEGEGAKDGQEDELTLTLRGLQKRAA